MDIFSQLYLDDVKHLHEFAGCMEVVHVRDGTRIPMMKKGMFVLLEGRLKVRTHWKLCNGQGMLQKHYLAHVYKQQGLMTKTDELRAAIREFKDAPSVTDEAEVSSDSELSPRSLAELRVREGNYNYKKQIANFINERKRKEFFDQNVYIRKVMSAKFSQYSLCALTTHCSGQLQRMLLGEGQAQVKNDEAYSSKVTIHLMDQELKSLEDLIAYENEDGYSEGFALPGFKFH